MDDCGWLGRKDKKTIHRKQQGDERKKENNKQKNYPIVLFFSGALKQIEFDLPERIQTTNGSGSEYSSDDDDDNGDLEGEIDLEVFCSFFLSSCLESLDENKRSNTKAQRTMELVQVVLKD